MNLENNIKLSDLLQEPLTTKAKMILGSDIDWRLRTIFKLYDKGYTAEEISSSLKESPKSYLDEPTDVEAKIQRTIKKIKDLEDWDISILTLVANKLFTYTNIRSKAQLVEAITSGNLLPDSYMGQEWPEYSFFGLKCYNHCCTAVNLDPATFLPNNTANNKPRQPRFPTKMIKNAISLLEKHGYTVISPDQQKNN